MFFHMAVHELTCKHVRSHRTKNLFALNLCRKTDKNPKKKKKKKKTILQSTIMNKKGITQTSALSQKHNESFRLLSSHKVINV